MKTSSPTRKNNAVVTKKDTTFQNLCTPKLEGKRSAPVG